MAKDKVEKPDIVKTLKPYDSGMIVWIRTGDGWLNVCTIGELRAALKAKKG